MKRRQTLWPTRWLMTDERLGDDLLAAVDRLPVGGGVVLRHHSLDSEARQALGERIAERAKARGLTLAVSRDPDLARRLNAALVHNPHGPTDLPVSRSVHDEAQARAAAREQASLVFVSPLFATRSHPDARPLGAEQARRLAEWSGAPAIALGGMNEERFAALAAFHGFAGIDCWR